MWIRKSDLIRAMAVGIGATAVMDIAAEVIKRTRGVQTLNYGLLGRWIGHMPKGHSGTNRSSPHQWFRTRNAWVW